eukprot:13380338-Alexandrium_andersonii.AAC.1
MVSVAQDLGLSAGLQACSDSSAAIGICRRTRFGQVLRLRAGAHPGRRSRAPQVAGRAQPGGHPREGSKQGAHRPALAVRP